MASIQSTVIHCIDKHIIQEDPKRKATDESIELEEHIGLSYCLDERRFCKVLLANHHELSFCKSSLPRSPTILNKNPVHNRSSCILLLPSTQDFKRNVGRLICFVLVFICFLFFFFNFTMLCWFLKYNNVN